MTPEPTPTPATPPAAPETNPFRYGWRYVKRVGSEGKETLEQVPLTLEDVLHPQEDDVIPENYVHESERGDLTRIIRSRLDRVRNGLVLSDCIIDWGVAGVRNHSPDVSVFADLAVPPPAQFGTFHLADSGGRCLFLVELVSPHTRTNDVDAKIAEYHQVGVPLYVLVDQQRENGPRQLLVYRDTPAGYELAPLDEQGCFLLAPLGLRVGLRDNRTVCFDAQTGEVVGDYTQVTRAHAQAARALEVADQRNREQELAIEAAILKNREMAAAQRQAEEQARQEAAARAAAEQQARQEAEARAAAEQQARQEAEARRQEAEARAAAEEQARREAEARAAAEQRLRDLEALLQRLQQQPPPKTS
jgi:colicin import membrane protein